MGTGRTDSRSDLEKRVNRFGLRLPLKRNEILLGYEWITRRMGAILLASLAFVRGRMQADMADTNNASACFYHRKPRRPFVGRRLSFFFGSSLSVAGRLFTADKR